MQGIIEKYARNGNVDDIDWQQMALDITPLLPDMPRVCGVTSSSNKNPVHGAAGLNPVRPHPSACYGCASICNMHEGVDGQNMGRHMSVPLGRSGVRGRGCYANLISWSVPGWVTAHATFVVRVGDEVLLLAFGGSGGFV